MDFKISIKNLSLHLLFVPLFLIAYLLFQERLFFEQASDIFWLLNVKSFYFVHNRFILFFSQWLPLSAIYLNLPLKTVFILLSLGNVLYFYWLFVFVLHYLKDRLAAIAILLTHSIVILYTFFNTPMAEIWFGTAMLIVFYSMIANRRYHSLLDMILFVVVGFITVHSHPAILILIPFVVAFDFLENGRKSYWLYLVIAAFIALGIINIDQYSTESMVGYYGWGNPNVLEIFDLQYQKTFVFFMFYRYGALMALLIITSLVYIFRKEFLKLLLLLSFFLSYTLVMSVVAGVITNNNSGGLEIYYIPLASVVCIPFLYDVYKKTNRISPLLQNVTFIALYVIICYRIFLIYDTGHFYKRRTALIKRIIDHTYQIPGSKFNIIGENVITHNPMISWWTWPVESMLLSAIDGKEKTVNITPVEVVDFEKYESKLTDTTFRWLFGGLRDYNYLNSNYFHLETGPFLYLNTNRPLAPGFLSKVRIELIDGQKSTYSKHKPCGHICCDEAAEHVKVKIINDNETPLYSGLIHHLYLSYQWKKGNQPVEHESILTPLEVDVFDSYEQFITVRMPYETGDYTLSIDLVMEAHILDREVRFKKLPLNSPTAQWIDISQSMQVTIVN